MRRASARLRHAPSSSAASAARACSGYAATARLLCARGAWHVGAYIHWRLRASSTAATASYAHHDDVKPLTTTTTTTTGRDSRELLAAVSQIDTHDNGSKTAPGLLGPPARPKIRRYGSWEKLLSDYHRMLAATGTTAPTTETAGDLEFWAAIFTFAQRRGGDHGALLVWQEIFQRRQLYQVDGVAATAFWKAVVEAALRVATGGTDGMGADSAFLESTWAYAEWLLAQHGVQWPNYYRSVVLHLLRAGDGDAALRWHVRLSVHFAVARRDFFEMLQGFLVAGDDTTEGLQDTLRAIYATSRHRQLYDTVVPLLWAHGRSARARAWRETLVWHGDVPEGDAARPFLQFLAGYYPEDVLCDEEMALVNERPAQYLAPAAEGVLEKERDKDLPTNLYHLMNRVHGETFGIQDKSTTFNDRVGGRWFATTWVSLDTAIHLVYSLGVAEIGPLSLQSIALREGGDPAAIVRRLAQLERHHIGVGHSSYVRALRYLAQAGDAATLGDLLRTTLHPDVFDDAAQQQLLLFRGGGADWQTQRLLLAVRLAVEQDGMTAVANQLLLLLASAGVKEAGERGGNREIGEEREEEGERWEGGSEAEERGDPSALHSGTTTIRGKKRGIRGKYERRRKMALRLLDEMAARGIEVLPATVAALSRQTLRMVPRTFRAQDVPDVDFYAALGRRLLQLRLPVAAQAWQNMLCSLGEQGRLSALESVALDVAGRLVMLHEDEGPAPLLFKVHVNDVPEVVHGGVVPGGNRLLPHPPEMADVGYRLLPRDLSPDHPRHPLRLVFDATLLGSMVRWYFYRRATFRLGRGVRPVSVAVAVAGGGGEASDHCHAYAASASPAAFALAGGIRLVALLRDRGVAVDADVVRAETLLCMTALFGPAALARGRWQPARIDNQLTVGEVKGLCDAAWGTEEPLLPALEALEASLASLAPLDEIRGLDELPDLQELADAMARMADDGGLA